MNRIQEEVTESSSSSVSYNSYDIDEKALQEATDNWRALN